MNTLLSTVVSMELLTMIRAAYALSWNGIHGAAHWFRVRENGLRLASLTGADPTVVELFAVIHDCQRLSDGRDYEHGLRAAEWARNVARPLLPIDSGAFELLFYTCEAHTRGLTDADITVQTCWDADRLDLARVNIMPDPTRLCTAAARSRAILDWAIARSRNSRPGAPSQTRKG